MKEEFKRELQSLLNRYSIENLSDTPDFILADIICNFIEFISSAVKTRDKWHNFTANKHIDVMLKKD